MHGRPFLDRATRHPACNTPTCVRSFPVAVGRGRIPPPLIARMTRSSAVGCRSSSVESAARISGPLSTLQGGINSTIACAKNRQQTGRSMLLTIVDACSSLARSNRRSLRVFRLSLQPGDRSLRAHADGHVQGLRGSGRNGVIDRRNDTVMQIYPSPGISAALYIWRKTYCLHDGRRVCAVGRCVRQEERNDSSVETELQGRSAGPPR